MGRTQCRLDGCKHAQVLGDTFAFSRSSAPVSWVTCCTVAGPHLDMSQSSCCFKNIRFSLFVGGGGASAGADGACDEWVLALHHCTHLLATTCSCAMVPVSRAWSGHQVPPPPPCLTPSASESSPPPHAARPPQPSTRCQWGSSMQHGERACCSLLAR